MCIFSRSQHSISSCSRPAVGSNIVQITRATFFVNVFFFKWSPVAILDIQKSLCIAFLIISNLYHNIYFCDFFTKWILAALLDVRKSLSGAFLAISDQYNFFYKMAASAHFGCPKFTFDRISGHFRSLRNFIFWGNF